MEIIERFRLEYEGCFGRRFEAYISNLGFRGVVFTLSSNGVTEDLTVEGPGYDPCNKRGYEDLQTVLKEMKQKYNIMLETESRIWW